MKYNRVFSKHKNEKFIYIPNQIEILMEYEIRKIKSHYEY